MSFFSFSINKFLVHRQTTGWAIDSGLCNNIGKVWTPNLDLFIFYHYQFGAMVNSSTINFISQIGLVTFKLLRIHIKWISMQCHYLDSIFEIIFDFENLLAFIMNQVLEIWSRSKYERKWYNWWNKTHLKHENTLTHKA